MHLRKVWLKSEVECCNSSLVSPSRRDWQAPYIPTKNEVFKLTHNIYDESVSPQISFCTRSNTRRNNYKLLNHTFHYDLRKHFLQHVINIWNSLPNSGQFVIPVLNSHLANKCTKFEVSSFNRSGDIVGGLRI